MVFKSHFANSVNESVGKSISKFGTVLRNSVDSV